MTSCSCDPPAHRGPDRPARARHLLLVLGCTTLALLSACAAPVTSDRQTFSAAAIAPPRDALPLEEAVVRLAEATLAGAKDLPPPPGG
jgi:hypothetical protein